MAASQTRRASFFLQANCDEAQVVKLVYTLLWGGSGRKTVWVRVSSCAPNLLIEQRRDGRVVDCGGLENRWAERLRGFESLSLRNTKWRTSPIGLVFFVYRHMDINLLNGNVLIYKKESCSATSSFWVAQDARGRVGAFEVGERSEVGALESPSLELFLQKFIFCLVEIYFPWP